MAEIIWTKPALDELNDLVEYIKANNPAAAKKLVKTLFHKIGRLELFPESGRLVQEIKDLVYREIATKPCRIIYKADQKTAFILHIFDATKGGNHVD